MGSVFRRPGSRFLWIAYVDAAGERRQVSSKTSDEKQAEALLDELERRVEAQKDSGLVEDSGPLTVGKYARKWVRDRKARGVGSANDDEARLRYVLPKIGEMPLEDVRVRHIRDLVRDLVGAPRLARKGMKASGKPLAPRSVRHIYGVVRVMFSDAVAEELIPVTPCVLKERRKEIPAKKDADPLWRKDAVFTREEVETLISDERIPEDRRVLYALAFLLGARIGEISALRWSDWDGRGEPLGRMAVAKSFNHQTKQVKGVKTENPREVPVLPLLADVLTEWKRGGWPRMFLRTPDRESLIIPSREGRHRRATHVLRRFREDLELLGLRPRRFHDCRRTFISLARAGGARPNILKWVTHGPPPTIMDDYTSLPWETLCAEVLKLKIGVRREEQFGRVLAFAPPTRRCNSAATVEAANENGPQIQGLGSHETARSTGLEPVSESLNDDPDDA